MFYDGGFYMGGMHGLSSFFWVVLIAALVYSVWGHPGKRGGKPRETPLIYNAARQQRTQADERVEQGESAQTFASRAHP